MSWVRDGATLLFEGDATELSFELLIPNRLYHNLCEDVKERFDQEGEYWLLRRGGEGIRRCKRFGQEGYHLNEPRVVFDAEPKVLEEIDHLAQELKSKRILVYTGAGISKAAGVWLMDELEESLGLGRENWIEESSCEIEKLILRCKEFTRLCLESEPTVAHHALAKGVKEGLFELATENLDLLHEKSGVDPVRIDAARIRQGADLNRLAEVDYLISVGLSRDDKGLISWYKTQNPNGKIVALNLTKPSYLGSEDLLFKGDLQRVVPALMERLTFFCSSSLPASPHLHHSNSEKACEGSQSSN